MATKLKNLKVKKVDFVDEGANPDAHICMFKKKEIGGHISLEDGKKGNANILKKLLGFIGKAAGMEQEEIDSAVDEIQKGGSVGFNEKLDEAKNRKIADEIWDLCYALQSSLCSALNDKELDSAEVSAAMQESLKEFHTVVQECITQWSAGKVSAVVKKNEKMTETDLEVMKSARDRLTESIEKAAITTEAAENNIDKLKGDQDMKLNIDKSKLTPAEAAFLESIEKRCGTDDRTHGVSEDVAKSTEKNNEGEDSGNTEVNKSGKEEDKKPDVKKFVSDNGDGEDIYKGLHPAVKAEMEALRKFREDAEERELTEVAKKYEIIGKKPEELVPLFKSLKLAGSTAYNDMLAVFDQTVAAVEKSGLFSEVGRSGHDNMNGGAWAEADAKAVELMKSKTGLSKAQALDEVFIADPSLAERCEKED